MPSLKAIKKRIGSVKSTQKITKAMKMVAAAKLRRAQTAVFQGRVYQKACRSLMGRIEDRTTLSHPLLTGRPSIRNRELLVFTSDRGLCGGFNSNLLHKVPEFLQEQRGGGPIRLCLIGKKGRDYAKAKNWRVGEIHTGVYEKANEFATALITSWVNRFMTGETDEVWAVYNRFQSALVQVVTFEKLIPLGSASAPKTRGVDYLYEPEAVSVVSEVIQKTLEAHVRQIFLESQAAELAARMAAMDNATRNAADMIDYLALQFNRIRQATITKELMDIVNGAEAIR